MKKIYAVLCNLTLVVIIQPLLINNAAAAFPDKSVKIIIGFPAGGPLDAHIRLLQEQLQTNLGQQIMRLVLGLIFFRNILYFLLL